MYSNDPMRQQIASKYNEPVVPIEEVVVTPKYRTLPQNRFFRRPDETEQQYYRRMASQESITPYFPEKEIIAAELIGGLASKVAPRFSSRLGSSEKGNDLPRGLRPAKFNPYRTGKILAKRWMTEFDDTMNQIKPYTMPYVVRDENNQFEAFK